jgi:hypothetical protein
MVQSQSNEHQPRVYHGQNLSGWILSLGDALYAAPGEAPVVLGDIQTQDNNNHSLLRANVNVRRIMAHNITFKRFIGADAFNYDHHCQYQFRIPYTPSQDNVGLNPQTVEGGLFIWDGLASDIGLAWQWVLNPWQNDYGTIMTWGGDNVEWQPVGYLRPDTRWHTVQLILNTTSEIAQLRIDGRDYSAPYSVTSKSGFGTEIAARLQAEIISLFPSESGLGALHEAQFRNWSWRWLPN